MTDDPYVSSWIESFAPVTDIIKEPDEDEDWIVKWLLRPGTYMVVYGREGRGKSRIIYQLAAAIADSSSWFGCDVEDTGNVIFLQADMAPKESKAIIKSAAKMGLLRPNIFFPRVFGTIDVLTPEGKRVLEGIRERFEPKVIVIDTATDVFESKGHHKDDSANGPIRECIRVFRTIFPNAGLIFVLHERKTSQYLQAKGVEDEDSALGGGEWTRKAASVVRLKGINETHAELQIRKTRDKRPFTKLSLRRNSQGFFEIEPSELKPQQALLMWPHLDGIVWDGVLPVTVSGVCKSLEETTKGAVKFDALRKAYGRAKERDVEFGWECWLDDNNGLGHPKTPEKSVPGLSSAITTT
jgi:hypothetical protein